MLSFKSRYQCDPMSLEKLHRNPKTPRIEAIPTTRSNRRRRHIIIAVARTVYFVRFVPRIYCALSPVTTHLDYHYFSPPRLILSDVMKSSIMIYY